MGMRNELRNSGSSTYNWANWYSNMVAAANGIHSANPNVLIFFSGLGYDTDLSPIPNAGNLGGGYVFHKNNFAFSNRIVLELHNYETGATSCSSLQNDLQNAGFSALGNVANQLPVVLTEWGHAQDGSTYNSVYASCLRSYLPQLKAGWMVWVIAGSYYIRSGTQDYDETWGEFNLFYSLYLRAILPIIVYEAQSNANIVFAQDSSTTTGRTGDHRPLSAEASSPWWRRPWLRCRHNVTAKHRTNGLFFAIAKCDCIRLGLPWVVSP